MGLVRRSSPQETIVHRTHLGLCDLQSDTRSNRFAIFGHRTVKTISFSRRQDTSLVDRARIRQSAFRNPGLSTYVTMRDFEKIYESRDSVRPVPEGQSSGAQRVHEIASLVLNPALGLLVSEPPVR